MTSAWDIALMSRELILRHPDLRRFTTIWMDTIRGGEFGLSNTNKLIRFYEGATGLKTGSTGSAGYCISATAEREGMELIAVVLGGETSAQRFEDAKTMLNYGFSTYTLVDAAGDTALEPVPVTLGEEAWVQPVLEGGKLLIQRSQAGSLTREIQLPETLEAPVEEGTVLGSMTVRCGEETLYELPLQAREPVARLTLTGLWGRVLLASIFAQTP